MQLYGCVVVDKSNKNKNWKGCNLDISAFQGIAGNIITASPISDLNPLFLSASCKLELASKGNVIFITNEKTFHHINKNIIKTDDSYNTENL